MNYLFAAIVYLLVGSLLTAGIWKAGLSEFANPDKKLLLAICFSIIVLIWPYWLVSIIFLIIVGTLEPFITNNEPILAKIPFMLFVMVLCKMYEKMWGVKLFPQRFEEYQQEA